MENLGYPSIVGPMQYRRNLDDILWLMALMMGMASMLLLSFGLPGQ
jgi:hypothetical protein